jgi:hypothetical protein
MEVEMLPLNMAFMLHVLEKFEEKDKFQKKLLNMEMEQF